ncbi:MAG TPA: NUDIX domain-containing protein [Planctomycetaceae bacterium]|nr:NUDIX domain-containing protein [Planctomycetaceae bacterium]
MNPTDEPRERVAIAVVEHQGCYLVGTRRSDQPLAGRSEFPGGRCLLDEEGSACAIRECREETGLAVTAVRRLCDVRHTYAHGAIELEFWLCRLGEGESPERAGGGFVWVPSESLKSHDFPEANRTVLEILGAGPQSAS